MTHKEWIAQVADVPVEHLSVNAIATKAGLVQSTLARRLAGPDGITAEQAIAIARAYNVDVIRALLDLEILNDEDVKRPEVEVTLADATDLEIVGEVARRIAAGPAHEIYDRPINLTVAPDTVEPPAEESLAANTGGEESEQ